MFLLHIRRVQLRVKVSPRNRETTKISVQTWNNLLHVDKAVLWYKIHDGVEGFVHLEFKSEHCLAMS